MLPQNPIAHLFTAINEERYYKGHGLVCKVTSYDPKRRLADVRLPVGLPSLTDVPTVSEVAVGDVVYMYPEYEGEEILEGCFDLSHLVVSRY